MLLKHHLSILEPMVVYSPHEVQYSRLFPGTCKSGQKCSKIGFFDGMLVRGKREDGRKSLDGKRFVGPQD
jgi:hypothetical protein